MQNFLQMAGIQSLLFLYIAVGYLCRKANLMDESARKPITDFVIYISLPCMVFDSFKMQLTAQALKEGGQALLIAAIMSLVMYALGKLLYNWCPPDERKVMQYGTLVSNSGFAGLPVVESAYGAEGLFLASLFVVPTRIMMWSAGISLFHDTDRKTRIKNVLLNPGIIAVELGLLRMAFNPTIPSVAQKAISGLSACTTPLAMFIVGLILAEVDLKTVLNGKAFFLSAVRQLVLPLGLLVALRALGVPALTTSVAVVMTGMPIGSTTAILAAKYNANHQFAAKCVVISTLTSLLTVPLLTLFL